MSAGHEVFHPGVPLALIGSGFLTTYLILKVYLAISLLGRHSRVAGRRVRLASTVVTFRAFKRHLISEVLAQQVELGFTGFLGLLIADLRENLPSVSHQKAYLKRSDKVSEVEGTFAFAGRATLLALVLLPVLGGPQHNGLYCLERDHLLSG